MTMTRAGLAQAEATLMLDNLTIDGMDDPVALAAARTGAWAELVASGQARVEFWGSPVTLATFVTVSVLWASAHDANGAIDGFALREVD